MNENLPIYFLDIETVSEKDPRTLKELPTLFTKKFNQEIENSDKFFGDFYSDKAGLHAEFGKIVCASIGRLLSGKFHIRTICSRDERVVIAGIHDSLLKATAVCAHNGLDFDYPYIVRRCIVNRMPAPQILNTAGVKTYELQDRLMDTMKIWSGTQWNYKVSLQLLAEIFGLPSPKKDMSGNQVNDIYWKMFDGVKNTELPFDAEKEALTKIATYCSGDIFTLANVYCRLKGLEAITEDQIVYA